MTPSENLYLLIQSLSSDEKAYFKKYAKIHSQNKVNNYLILFDIISKMKEYEEKVLVQKLNEKGLKFNLPTAKNQLQNLILKLMRNYGESLSSPRVELANLLKDVEFLYSKSHYNLCLKSIHKGLKISRDKNHLQYEHSFVIWKYRLAIWTQPYDGFSETVEHYKKSIELVEKELSNVNNLHYAMMDMMKLQLRPNHTREEVIEVFNSYATPELEELSDESKIFWYKLLGLKDFLIKDYDMVITHLLNMRSLLDNNFEKLIDFHVEYQKLLANLAESYRYVEKYDLALQAAEDLIELCDYHDIFKTKVYYKDNPLFGLKSKLEVLIETRRLNELAAVVIETKSFFEKWSYPTTPWRPVLDTKLAMSVSYWHLGDIKTAHFWLNSIVQSKYEAHNHEFVLFVKLFQIIIYLESDDFIAAESCLRSAKRFYANQKESPYLDLVLNYCRKEINGSLKKESNRNLILGTINSLSADEAVRIPKKRLFNGLDWMKNRLKN